MHLTNRRTVTTADLEPGMVLVALGAIHSIATREGTRDLMFDDGSTVTANLGETWAVEERSDAFAALHTVTGDRLTGPWVVGPLATAGRDLAWLNVHTGDVVPFALAWAERDEDEESPDASMSKDAIIGAVGDILDLWADAEPGMSDRRALARISRAIGRPTADPA